MILLYKEGGPLLLLEHWKYQEKVILPYLLHGTPESDNMKLIGKGRQYVTIDSLYASALLRPSPLSPSSTLPKEEVLEVAPYSCLIVPEASIEVMSHLGQLLHTGR